MPTEIPDLWPDHLRERILTPLAILRIQAAKLRQKTDGLLEAEVVSSRQNITGVMHMIHRFEVFAPAIDYRHQLLICRHPDKVVYPASIESDHFPLPKGEVIPVGDGTVVEIHEGPFDLYRKRTARSQPEFLQVIAEILTSPGVVSVLQSMIAQSNEASGVDGTSPLPTE